MGRRRNIYRRNTYERDTYRRIFGEERIEERRAF